MKWFGLSFPLYDAVFLQEDDAPVVEDVKEDDDKDEADDDEDDDDDDDDDKEDGAQGHPPLSLCFHLFAYSDLMKWLFGICFVSWLIIYIPMVAVIINLLIYVFPFVDAFFWGLGRVLYLPDLTY